MLRRISTAEFSTLTPKPGLETRLCVLHAKTSRNCVAERSFGFFSADFCLRVCSAEGLVLL